MFMRSVGSVIRICLIHVKGVYRFIVFRAINSVGRVSALHAESQRFESSIAHFICFSIGFYRCLMFQIMTITPSN
jgi:hypothetical protein